MEPRRVTLAVAVAALALLIAAAFSQRWFTAELGTGMVEADVRIGLTSLEVCGSTGLASTCQEVAWKEVSGGTGSGTIWMWIGRLTFALALASAVGLAVLAARASGRLDLGLPFALPRVILRLALGALPLCAFYYLMAPSPISTNMEVGRGFLFGFLGFVLATIAGWREVEYG